MPTILLYIVLIIGGLVLLDLFRKKDAFLGKEMMKQILDLNSEIEHLKHRVEHLEAIASEEEFDVWQAERNKDDAANDKAHLKSN